jgi:hypothetical protein
MKNELIALIGWTVGVQGALGLAGDWFGNGPWGLLQQWWDVPALGYAALLALGLMIALTAGAARKAPRR